MPRPLQSLGARHTTSEQVPRAARGHCRPPPQTGDIASLNPSCEQPVAAVPAEPGLAGETPGSRGRAGGPASGRPWPVAERACARPINSLRLGSLICDLENLPAQQPSVPARIPASGASLSVAPLLGHTQRWEARHLGRGAAEEAAHTCSEPSLREADCGTQSWNGDDSGGQEGQAEGEEAPGGGAALGTAFGPQAAPALGVRPEKVGAGGPGCAHCASVMPRQGPGTQTLRQPCPSSEAASPGWARPGRGRALTQPRCTV